MSASHVSQFCKAVASGHCTTEQEVLKGVNNGALTMDSLQSKFKDKIFEQLAYKGWTLEVHHDRDRAGMPLDAGDVSSCSQHWEHGGESADRSGGGTVFVLLAPDTWWEPSTSRGNHTVYDCR